MIKLGLLLAGLFVLSGCFPDKQNCSDVISSQNPNQVIIDNGECGGVGFNVELALTAEQQMQGLMNRTSMEDTAGMLFIFNDEKERGFWMKNTLIPLDMIFIKKDGVIHHIHENAQPNDLTSIKSQGPVMAVLEVNGGIADKLNIKEGDIIHHPFFNNLKAQ